MSIVGKTWNNKTFYFERRKQRPLVLSEHILTVYGLVDVDFSTIILASPLQSQPGSASALDPVSPGLHEQLINCLRRNDYATMGAFGDYSEQVFHHCALRSGSHMSPSSAKPPPLGCLLGRASKFVAASHGFPWTDMEGPRLLIPTTCSATTVLGQHPLSGDSGPASCGQTVGFSSGIHMSSCSE